MIAKNRNFLNFLCYDRKINSEISKNNRGVRKKSNRWRKKN